MRGTSLSRYSGRGRNTRYDQRNVVSFVPLPMLSADAVCLCLSMRSVDAVCLCLPMRSVDAVCRCGLPLLADAVCRCVLSMRSAFACRCVLSMRSAFACRCGLPMPLSRLSRLAAFFLVTPPPFYYSSPPMKCHGITEVLRCLPATAVQAGRLPPSDRTDSNPVPRLHDGTCVPHNLEERNVVSW